MILPHFCYKLNLLLVVCFRVWHLIATFFFEKGIVFLNTLSLVFSEEEMNKVSLVVTNIYCVPKRPF